MTRLKTAAVAVLLAATPTASWAESIEARMLREERNITSEVPLDTGNGVTLLGAAADGKLITYGYKISIPFLGGSQKTRIVNAVRDKSCKALEPLLKRGARYTYIYYDVHDKLFLRFSVASEECKEHAARLPEGFTIDE